MRKKVALLLAGILFLAGCAPTMSTKAKTTMILSTYNRQAELTKADAIRCLERGAACTEAERERIREKKEIITRLKGLVLPYGVIVNSGGVPNPEDEQAIYDLIDQLTDTLTP